MKILEICMSKGFGGLELYVLKVSKYLHMKNFNVTVFSKSRSFLSKNVADNKINNSGLNFVFHHFPILSSFKLAQYIDSHQIDVLHVHWGKDLFFTVLAKIISRRKVKLVFTRQMSLTRKKHDVYHRFLYRNIDAFLVITKELYNDAIGFLPINEEKLHLLYYGVPAADGSKDVCDKYLNESGLGKSIFKLAIFGRVEKGKGQHLVIKAAKNILDKGHKIQVAIIGHVMDKDYFKQLENEIKENNLDGDIFYLGFHSSPTSIMPCFDAVVLATKCETFGLVLPEAMRAGVAVIGSNCGGVPEIIKHEKTGLLFESEDVTDLTKQLSKLVSDRKLCSKLAEAGKVDADERFSEDKHFRKLLEYFETA